MTTIEVNIVFGLQFVTIVDVFFPLIIIRLHIYMSLLSKP